MEKIRKAGILGSPGVLPCRSGKGTGADAKLPRTVPLIQVSPIGFQPSELAKIAIIIYLAMLIERIPKQLDKVSSMAKVGIRLVPLVLFVAVNNLSTAIIILGIAVCMLFVASPKYKEFFVVAVLGVLFIFAFINIASYRSDRVEAWKHPETAGDKGYQTMQALYAIGSGKLFGKGLGQSLQKLGNVPEAQNDMIFPLSVRNSVFSELSVSFFCLS